jgi:hypothetical protein
MASYFSATLSAFELEPPESVLGKLAEGMAARGFETNEATLYSWKSAVEIFQDAIRTVRRRNTSADSWAILLEYSIPMVEQRIDCVILAPGLVFVIEHKDGDSASGAQALRQAQAYALNLADFHEESRGKVVIPIAVGAFKTLKALDEQNPARGAIVNPGILAETLARSVVLWGSESAHVALKDWDASRYFPVPSIIEAASALYASHDVKDIAKSRAGTENLHETEACILNVVEDARRTQSKKIIVLTGVPGAGKTLAGLNAVQAIQANLDAREEQASFLSGNSPLVQVLQEALKRSAQRAGRRDSRAIRTRIRNMHTFVGESYENSRPPAERLLVFDEAQRAWTAKKNFKKFKRNVSEPEMILEIMGRHNGWAVVIALVGGGQEIHGGEAGLAAWGDALLKHSHWEVVTSPEALRGGQSLAGSRLFRSQQPQGVSLKEVGELHLASSKRSFETETTASWVNALLRGDADEARALTAQASCPIYLTRDLSEARAWLSAESASRRRVGLIASSGAARLRAEGVEPPTFTFLSGIDYKRWFLDESGDYRSSNQLEIALSEFEMQGLEIDISCLLWGGDLTFKNGKPVPRKLDRDGMSWCEVLGSGDIQAGADDNAVRILNKYRVLLTRFRKMMVIYVPIGSNEDSTRLQVDFDATYDHLKLSGLIDLRELQSRRRF